jgi:carbon storage regulator
MLVIKRKETESILIGDNIEIIISEISSDKVKICINAPSDVKISRKELVETSDFNKMASEKTSKYFIQNINAKLKKNEK